MNEAVLAAQGCGIGDDARQWHASWSRLAKRTYNEARSRLEANPVAAASGLLRACSYFRTSAFFLRGETDDDAERAVVEAYALSDQALDLASPHLEPALVPARIPLSDGSGFEMRAYCARTASPPPPGMKRRPLLVAAQGYDGDMAEAVRFLRLEHRRSEAH